MSVALWVCANSATAAIRKRRANRKGLFMAEIIQHLRNSPAVAYTDRMTATVPATSDATPMATLIKNAITNCYEPWAAAQTHTNLIDFNNAVAASKEGGPPAPTSYKVWNVNTALVTALMSGTDLNPDDWTKIWDVSDYTPPVAPPPPLIFPAGYPVGPLSAGNLYLAYDVAPLPSFPDGAVFGDARGQFLKHSVTTPFGRSSYWEKTA